MASSDRGLIDVERYDQDPQRPILHGLLGDVSTAELAGLSSSDKVPHVLRIVERARLSDRGAASLVEVRPHLVDLAQVAGDIAVGRPSVAEAVRRIGLGEPLPSGRVRIDVARALDDLAEPPRPPTVPPATDIAAGQDHPPEPVPVAIAAAVQRAPSGGNMQPWRIVAQNDSVTVEMATQYTSTMDVAYRWQRGRVRRFDVQRPGGGLGAQRTGSGHFTEDAPAVPLRAKITLADGRDDALAALVRADAGPRDQSAPRHTHAPGRGDGVGTQGCGTAEGGCTATADRA